MGFMSFLKFCVGILLLAATGNSQVVISQVYGGGGGGTAGIPYKNDYVELFNQGSADVSLAGWSVQYQASGSTGNFSGNVPLSGTILAHKYFLVQVSSAGTVGANLPTPDVTSTAISMSATTGKVALSSTTATLVTAVGPPVVCPSGGAVVDLVGYGAANCSEASPTAVLSNTTAAFRASAGCTDSNNNSTDFTVAAAAPRNSSSAANVCAGSTSPSATGSASPSPVL